MIISGNVPKNAGLNSSAALEVAIINFCKKIYDLSLKKIDVAKYAQISENKFVGCKCGIMDPLTSVFSKKGCAMILDCQSLLRKYVPIPKNLEILIINSNDKRNLVNSEYNIRRQQCEENSKIFDKKSLRDLSLNNFKKNQNKLDKIIAKRINHVLTENIRTLKFFMLLKKIIKTLFIN